MPAPARPDVTPTPVRPVRPAAALPWSAFAALVHRLGDGAGTAAPGGTLVVAVDGFSGAGKTWVAARLAAALGADLVHVDAYVPGWTGLPDGVRRLGRDLVGPWSRGLTGHAQLYDWDAGVPGDRLELPPPPLAVLEGSGIASLAAGSGLAVRVWVHAAPGVRADRLDAREDHLAYLPYRDTWARQEEALARRQETLRRCDVRVLRASTSGVHLAHPPAPPAPTSLADR